MAGAEKTIPHETMVLLLAALIKSNSGKDVVNAGTYKVMASLSSNPTITASKLEHTFRPLRKEAKDLLEANGEDVVPSPAKSPGTLKGSGVKRGKAKKEDSEEDDAKYPGLAFASPSTEDGPSAEEILGKKKPFEKEPVAKKQSLSNYLSAKRAKTSAKKKEVKEEDDEDVEDV